MRHMSFIPESFIDDVLARTDLVELIHARVPLKKKGKEYAACCPFHQEKTPSFYVNPDKQFYHCFGCGAHGNAVSFLMDYEHRDFRGAIEELATRAGMTLPVSEVDHQALEEQATMRDSMSFANSHFKQSLRMHQEAIDYLKQRGVNGRTAALFELGFAPNGNRLLAHCESQPKIRDELRELGLIVQKDDGEQYDRFRRRIMFPIRDKRGQIIGFGGRIVGPGEPKYLNSPESKLFHKGRNLYGLYEAKLDDARPACVIIVEGYMDVVMLAQHGVRNVVATMGTATTDEQIQQLYRFSPSLVFCFDGDAAGRRAATKALHAALPHLSDGRDLRFLFLPDGEDPDSFIQAKGESAFIEQIEYHSLSFDNFILQLLDQMEPGQDTAAMAKKSKQGNDWIRALPDGSLKRITQRRINEHTGVWRPQKKHQTPFEPTLPRSKPQSYAKQTVILAIILKHPELLPRVLEPEAWFNAQVPEGFHLLAAQPQELWTQLARESWGEEETKTALTIQFQGIETPESAQEILHDTLIQLHRSALDSANKLASRQALTRFMATHGKEQKT